MGKIKAIHNPRAGVPCLIESKNGQFDNVEFRSMAEARFAIFLDHHNIPAAYEPIKTGGYVPDFVSGKVAIEIKPAQFIHEAHKIESLMLKGSQFDLRAALVVDSMKSGYRILKYFSPYIDGHGGDWNAPDDHYGMECLKKCSKCDCLHFYGYGYWACWSCGYYDGDRTAEYLGDFNLNQIGVVPWGCEISY